jgi:hypothetical protein
MKFSAPRKRKRPSGLILHLLGRSLSAELEIFEPVAKSVEEEKFIGASSEEHVVKIWVDGKKITRNYPDVWSKKPIISQEGRTTIVWPISEYITLDEKIIENLVTRVPWDPSSFHEACSFVETRLLKTAVRVVNYYAKGYTLSTLWWSNFHSACLLVAAFRDYHDLRMGMLKHPHLSHKFLDAEFLWQIRDLNHFYRIYNITVFSKLLHDTVKSGKRELDTAVRRLMMDGVREVPLITKSRFSTLLRIIRKVRGRRVECVETDTLPSMDDIASIPAA